MQYDKNLNILKRKVVMKVLKGKNEFVYKSEANQKNYVSINNFLFLSICHRVPKSIYAVTILGNKKMLDQDNS